ncbi:CGNR zinc finger domain-containing protein [Streptomyces hoynatensis]|uniref:Zf-CGNR multi-domain protein n=1 Tax=Streptomyces hoynatensis TaxID=1141874 RepID=A0A3A9Z6V9_9ACTN|nr:CGNR zinc finger domain-containing protein [Streptomyces hoynatensis]RKN43799.1 zf-CGNR multi-domain protein [Streptomyces hoynatensis]
MPSSANSDPADGEPANGDPANGDPADPGAAHRGLVLRSHTGAAYRFDPGALCLELLTTGGPGPFRRYEVLHHPGDLAAWAGRSRLSPTPELRISPDEVAQARRVRDALCRVVLAHVRGEPHPPGDVAAVNEAAARPALAPALGPSGTRRWAGTPDGTQLLATVARDAVELLSGPYGHRVRVCAAEDCHLLYVDTSRPGRRRWCSMEHCGNRHKVRALRARRSPEG